MRVSILIVLALISFTVCSTETEPVRKLLTGFFQTIRGNSWKLSDNCLAGQTDINVQKIKAAIVAQDYLTVFNYFKDLKNQLAKSCPIDELDKMDKEITNVIKSGAFLSNFFNNMDEVLRLVNEESSHITNMSIDEIGAFVGKLYKILISGTPHNLRFLAAPMRSLVGPTFALEFINGFLQATSDVPLDQNKCIRGTTTFLPDVASAVEQFYQALLSKTGVKEAFVNFVTVAYKLNDVESYCHLIGLATELSITGYTEIAKISFRITEHLSEVINNVKGAFTSAKAKDFKGFGINVGKLFQILFNYHTQ